MINIHFSWAWLLIAAVMIIGLYIASPFLRDNNNGIGGSISAAVGCMIVLVAILIALVFGGITIW